MFSPVVGRRERLAPTDPFPGFPRPKHGRMFLVYEIQGKSARGLAQGKCFLGRNGEGISPAARDPLFIPAGFEFPNTHETIF